MRVRLKDGVFVRHFDDESAVVCLRTGGCTVMRDARPFLECLSKDWMDVDEIRVSLAKVFSCQPEDLLDDVYAIIGELESQGFSERDGWIEELSESGRLGETVGGLSVEKEGDSDTPFGEFCSRHGMLSELHMDLTDRCNERCVHCYVPQNGRATMPTDLALKVIQEFREMEGLTLYVSGGECLLHPDFTLILREAKRLDLNIIVMSNLIACNDMTVSLLKEIDPQFVNVSLYSMRPNEHDAITGVAKSWEKTMTAIRALKSAGVHVRLATPILKENKDAVDELQKFAAEMQMHDVVDCDVIGRMDHDCSNQDHALALDEAKKFMREHRAILGLEKCDGARCEPDSRVCEIGDFKLNINARGDYYPCDGGQGIVLGNATKDALREIWNGNKLNTLRVLRNRDFPRCVTCSNRPWCKVCIVRNFNETGDIFAPSQRRCAFTAIQREVMEG